MDESGQHHKYFHLVDYFVFVLMFVLSLAIGAFFAFRSRRTNTTEEYLMGSRKLGLIPVTISLCVSLVSTNTLLGAPAEMYSYGVMYCFNFIGIIISILIVAISFVPLFYPLKFTSVNKYLYLRFNSTTAQLTGTSLLLFTQVLYVGCVIFGPATALEAVTGIPPWASVLLVGAIGTIYTAFGGMKAVIWTDVFQSSVMLAGLIALIIEGCRKAGGISHTWNMNAVSGRLNVSTATSLTERFTFPSMVFGFGAFWIAAYGVNQSSVQRFLAMETERKGKMAILLTGPGFILFSTLASMTGMVAFAYYQIKGCDPLAAGYITNGNQITPYFMMEILAYPGLPGLFVSSLFSASLSTLSSSINSMAAVVWEDLLIDRVQHIPEVKKTLITKALSAFFGVLCTGISFLVMAIGGNLVQIGLSFVGIGFGPLLGIFLLGALVPWANWMGAVTGSMVGLGVSVWLLAGQISMKKQRQKLPTRVDGCIANTVINGTTMMLETLTTESTITSLSTTSKTTEESGLRSSMASLYELSFNWYPFMGAMLVLLVGMLISAITLQLSEEHVDDRLFLPFVNYFRPKKYIQGSQVTTRPTPTVEEDPTEVTSI